MDLIEKAAKRLEELRRAGIDIPEGNTQDVAAGQATRGQEPKPRLPVSGPALPVRPGASPTVVTPAPNAPVSRRVELDMAGLASRGVVTPDSARSLLADEMRVLKRPLLHNAGGKGAAKIRDANLIMVTSAVPGEGKTTLSANLAMSIAMEYDHTVLLVDADVARPSLPGVLGLGHDKGLLDLLQNSSLDLSEVLLRTNIENLSILPAGTQHPRATELLASEAMNNLLADMASRYSDRIIIFDSPPLLLTTEARALATHMGQVVLVVRAESTTHNEVKAAVTAIAACDVKMVVLNQASGSVEGHGYGFGYGYGYGYGRGPGDNEPSSSQAEG